MALSNCMQRQFIGGADHDEPTISAHPGPLAIFWMICGSADAQKTGISSNGKQRALLLDITNHGQQVAASVGQRLQITLGTVGPGSYDETPQISSPAVRFERVHFKLPPNPGGPIQVYVFRADAEGKAEIRIPHINDEPVSRPTFVVTIQVGQANPK
jgi:hypothetical protein